jgi:hypothetical protein
MDEKKRKRKLKSRKQSRTSCQVDVFTSVEEATYEGKIKWVDGFGGRRWNCDTLPRREKSNANLSNGTLI